MKPLVLQNTGFDKICVKISAVLYTVTMLNEVFFGGIIMAIFWAIMAPFMGTALLGQMLETYIPGAEAVFVKIAEAMFIAFGVVATFLGSL